MGGNRGTEICSCIFPKLFARPRPPHPFLARTAPRHAKKPVPGSESLSFPLF